MAALSIKLRKVKPGDPVRAEDWNAMIDVLNKVLNLHVGQGLQMNSAAGMLTIQGMAPTRLEHAELSVDVRDKDGNKTADVLSRGGGSLFGPEEWQDAGRTVEQVASPTGNGVWLKGERRLLYAHPQSGKNMILPGLGLHAAALTSQLDYASAATAKIYRQDPAAGTFTVTSITVNVYDWMLLPGESIASGTHIAIVQLAHSRLWLVIAAACDPDPNITAPGGGGGGGAGGGSSGSTATLVSQPTNSNPALWPPTTMAFPWGN